MSCLPPSLPLPSLLLFAFGVRFGEVAIRNALQRPWLPLHASGHKNGSCKINIVFSQITLLPSCDFSGWVSAVDLRERHPIPSSFWPGWANIHRDFSRIPVTMASEWQTDIWQILFIKWDLWMSAITAIIFFVFFGSTQESRTVYSSIYRTVSAKIGFRQSVVCNQPVETRNISRDTVQSIPV